MKDAEYFFLGMAMQAMITALLWHFRVIEATVWQQFIAAVIFMIIAFVVARLIV